MENIKKLTENLNLIYYEYDKNTNSFVPDKNFSKELIYEELIKITHTFTKNDIIFFVDEKQTIFINSKDSIFAKIKRFFNDFFKNIQNKNLDIYILSDKKVKWAKNLPIFQIKPIKSNLDFSSYDALIFTSKNAIKSLNSFNNAWKTKPLYVIAPQTAKIAKKLGGKVKFVGKEKHGNEFANELLEVLKNKKVLYIRGSKVVSELVNILNSNSVNCDEAIVYETVCMQYKEKIKLPKNSTVIFSSPSTIECFLKNAIWDESYSAISIGHTTQKYFPPHIKPVISDTTSLESCVKKAIELKNKTI
ncbi:MAG: uroporphyrinogen-III synthase [Campylobacterota bacterium]|nr:uroporphyrinogen-III synthase [Campylobacterota bacterium]